MDGIIRLTDSILVGRQPTEAELQELHGDGCMTIVNFRHDGEDHEPLSPEAEGECVERLAMGYLHVPISLKELTPAQVNSFRREFANVPRPVFAHCKTGRRAGLMLMMDLGTQQHWGGQQVVAKAEALGFHCDTAETRQFVMDYVESYAHVR